MPSDMSSSIKFSLNNLLVIYLIHSYRQLSSKDLVIIINNISSSLFEVNPTVTPLYMSQSKTKPTKWHVQPVKTLISMGILPV